MSVAQRQYLTEDLAQIQRYFPGAKPVALRTPFDITPKPRRIIRDAFRATQTETHWGGLLRWTM
jgi:hypothetical protein